MRRVVITGMGMVSPLAKNFKESWQKIINSQSGIAKISDFDVTDIPSKIAGQVATGSEEFNPDDYMTPKEQKKTDKFVIFGYSAAIQAINDAGWHPDGLTQKSRTGTVIGCGIGGLTRIYDTSVALHEGGHRKVSPFFIPASLINIISGHVSIKYGFTGPNHSVSTACASGTHAIGDAARIIQCNDADVMIAGGSEAAVSRLGLSGFAAARALSTNFNDTPTQASRPWDEDRDGFVIGEGSGMLVLEELEHAKKRNAKIYAEIVGYGMSGDAHHITSPPENGHGGYLAMQNAIKSAKISPEDIDYLNAHGTSTPLGDAAEISGIKQAFKEHISKIAISSTKSSTGHLLGASGGIEAIFSTLAITNRVVPPTLNLVRPSKEFAGINLVPHNAQEKKITYSMTNSFGFGGTNASLVLKRFE